MEGWKWGSAVGAGRGAERCAEPPFLALLCSLCAWRVCSGVVLWISSQLCGKLIQRGVDVNAVDEDGKSALAFGAESGHTEVYALAGGEGGMASLCVQLSPIAP